jgi:putative SOS response-associated peptidase YedK
MPANSLLAEIDSAKSRMPAILRREQRELWLLEAEECAATALAAHANERMIAYATSSRVDAPQNTDETLLEPLQT